MSDALPTDDLLGLDADDDLMFDEAPPVEPALPVETSPPVAAAMPVEADAGTSKRGRALRLGRASKKGAASPGHMSASALASSMPTLSAAAPSATTEEPAGAPAPFPPQGADPAGSNSSNKPHPLIWAVVGLALLTSTISLGGMIAVGRTLAQAGTDRSEAARDRAALAGVPQAIAHLDVASARLDAAMARLGSASPAPAGQAAAPGQALTTADLHREIDGLKLALGEHQPNGLGALEGTTREGLSELATKVDRLADQIAQQQRGNAKR